jgi:tartrate dehydrogenase/decarboxylase/D-malate dehydrogenase
MGKHRIAVIPGDGIGKEVVPEGIRVLEAAGAMFGIGFQWDELPWSCEYYAKTGRMMPEDGLEQIRNHDAIYLGAVGFPSVPAQRPTSMASTLPTPLARSGRAR